MASVTEAAAVASEVRAALDAARDILPDAARGRATNTAASRKRFRASIAWRRARYAALSANAARHGGVAECELCSATAATSGAPLHVDHIEPLSKCWERRFDRTNLQVLCADCNVGKLDGPAQDFRNPTED